MLALGSTVGKLLRNLESSCSLEGWRELLNPASLESERRKSREEEEGVDVDFLDKDL